MNVFIFNKILKNATITGSLILNLYEKEKKKGILFHKKLDDLIKEHYETLIENKYPDNLPYILDILRERENMKTFIIEKMIYNLVMASNSEFVVIIRSNYGFEWKEYIEENIDVLLEKLSLGKIQRIILAFPNLSKTCQDKISICLSNQKEKYIEYLLFGKLKEYTVREDYNSLLEIIIKLVDEVLSHEQKNYFDIKKKKSGHYSDVVEIGSKVIKLGRNRRTYVIPYDKRILTPIIRFDFLEISNLNVVLEVTEKVDCDYNLTDETIYSIYREMRDRGIICTDMREENIGTLLKDNVSHWKKQLCDDSRTRGITDVYNDDTLGTGNLVILDLDYIYKENSKYVTWAHSPTRDLEFKYQNEQRELYKVKKLGKRK